MRNCLEFPKPLYFGRDTGLNIGGHGAVCNHMESGDSGSTNCEIPLPAKKFSFGVLLFWTVSFSFVISFLQFLFVLIQFALLLDYVFLAFLKPFFFIAAGRVSFFLFLKLLYFLLYHL
jgi:hypothetical protein